MGVDQVGVEDLKWMLFDERCEMIDVLETRRGEQ
jgi:hypothetical protein